MAAVSNVASDDRAAPAPRLQGGVAGGGHLPRLDGFRGAAVLVVTVYHFALGYHARSLPGRVIEQGFHLGWMGVDGFFVLSGFLISGILMRTKEKPLYFKNFYMRRLLRISPLYYGVLFLVFAVLPHFVSVDALDAHNTYDYQGWFWAYAMNIKEALMGGTFFRSDKLWIEHMWSLCVEEHFYLVWPLVVWLASPRSLLKIALGVCVAALVLRVALMMNHVDPWIITTLTPCRVDSLALGAAVAILVREPASTHWLRQKAWWGAGLGLVYLVAFVAMPRRVIAPETMSTFGFTAIAIGFASLLTLLLYSSPNIVTSVFEGRVLTTFGKYSYAAYVLHPFMHPVFARWLPVEAFVRVLHVEVLAIVVQISLGVAASMAAAFLSWHAYEKHFLKLKRYFEYEAPAPREGARSSAASSG
jgi:peptidoglycan/LPS O-acetylase OafA/YrhL